MCSIASHKEDQIYIKKKTKKTDQHSNKNQIGLAWGIKEAGNCSVVHNTNIHSKEVKQCKVATAPYQLW